MLKFGVSAISKWNLKKRKIQAAMDCLEVAPAMEEDPVTVWLGPLGPLFQQLRSAIGSQDSRLKRDYAPDSRIYLRRLRTPLPGAG